MTRLFLASLLEVPVSSITAFSTSCVSSSRVRSLRMLCANSSFTSGILRICQKIKIKT